LTAPDAPRLAKSGLGWFSRYGSTRAVLFVTPALHDCNTSHTAHARIVRDAEKNYRLADIITLPARLRRWRWGQSAMLDRTALTMMRENFANFESGLTDLLQYRFWFYLSLSLSCTADIKRYESAVLPPNLSQNTEVPWDEQMKSSPEQKLRLRRCNTFEDAEKTAYLDGIGVILISQCIKYCTMEINHCHVASQATRPRNMLKIEHASRDEAKLEA
jgi:hypothetical protein